MRASLLRFLLLTMALVLAVIEYLTGFILDGSSNFRCFSRKSVVKDLDPHFSQEKSVQKFPNKTHLISKFKNLDDRKQSLCDEFPSHLGPVQVKTSDILLSDVEKKYPEVHWGGWYAPSHCTARHKVAIIVPYRDRRKHLSIFINHIHPFLIKQQLEYGIFIIQQNGNYLFNRAKLLNVGVMESRKQKSGGDWECFVFHDVDLLPIDGRNIYSCPHQPRHMSVSINNEGLPYIDLFGGVSAMTYEQFTKVNGFPNTYWGWGGEDDDMHCRLKYNNFTIFRYDVSIAKYIMLSHKRANPGIRYQFYLDCQSTSFKYNGLSTLHYEVVKIDRNHLYTRILVNIRRKKTNINIKKYNTHHNINKKRTNSVMSAPINSKTKNMSIYIYDNRKSSIMNKTDSVLSTQ